ARVVGPAVAGIVYGAVGPAGCFALNACGFVVFAVALAQIRFPHRPVATRPPMAHALREGLGYARSHPVIWPARALAAPVSHFGLFTIGSLVLGALGDWIGLPAALASGGVVVAVAGAAALVRAPGLVGVVPQAVEA